MKKIIILILLSLNFFSDSFSQKIYTSEQDIYNTNEIIFYGYDYSDFRLVDAKRLDEDLKKFVFVWIEFCLEHITEKKLPKWLGKDRVTFNFAPTLALNRKLKTEDLGDIIKHSISKDSVQSFVNRYKIDEKEGIGFVVIEECFDNNNKTVSGHYTFFDIATKKVLMSEYVSSKDRNSYNRISDWGAALIIAFTEKFLPIYKAKLQTYKDSINNIDRK